MKSVRFEIHQGSSSWFRLRCRVTSWPPGPSSCCWILTRARPARCLLRAARHRLRRSTTLRSRTSVLFRAERRHLIRPDVVLRHPPDIAVEVLSPSTSAPDRGGKMRMFARHGVRDYRIVDPVHEQIEVHPLADGSYGQAQVASGEDIVRSVLLPDLTCEAVRAFAR